MCVTGQRHADEAERSWTFAAIINRPIQRRQQDAVADEASPICGINLSQAARRQCRQVKKSWLPKRGSNDRKREAETLAQTTARAWQGTSRRSLVRKARVPACSRKRQTSQK